MMQLVQVMGVTRGCFFEGEYMLLYDACFCRNNAKSIASRTTFIGWATLFIPRWEVLRANLAAFFFYFTGYAG